MAFFSDGDKCASRRGSVAAEMDDLPWKTRAESMFEGRKMPLISFFFSHSRLCSCKLQQMHKEINFFQFGVTEVWNLFLHAFV